MQDCFVEVCSLLYFLVVWYWAGIYRWRKGVQMEQVYSRVKGKASFEAWEEHTLLWIKVTWGILIMELGAYPILLSSILFKYLTFINLILSLFVNLICCMKYIRGYRKSNFWSPVITGYKSSITTPSTYRSFLNMISKFL